MSKEAMKLALEALEVATTPFARDRQEVLRAQAALREALAEQPAPVQGWKLVPVEPTQKMLDAPPNAYPADALVTWKAMLAAAPQPAQRKPLTLGQKQRLWSGVGDKPTLKDRVNAYGLAIEAAHNIKGDA